MDVEKIIKNRIISQIIFYLFIIFIFFVVVYESPLIYISSLAGLFSLVLFLYFASHEKTATKQVSYYFILIIIIALMFFPLNPFYELFGRRFEDALGTHHSFDPILFGFYFFWLFIFAIISQTIIALYFRYKYGGVPVAEGYGTWDYFLDNTTFTKIFLLVVLLTVASIFEEIIFRYLIMNFLYGVGLPLILVIIVSSVIFGLAHYGNGGWIYCINSTFAGFIFAFIFLDSGLLTAWFLHFLWNFLVIYQLFLPKLYGSTTQSFQNPKKKSKKVFYLE